MKRQSNTIIELYADAAPIPSEIRRKIEAIDEVQGYGSIIGNKAFIQLTMQPQSLPNSLKLRNGNLINSTMVDISVTQETIVLKPTSSRT